MDCDRNICYAQDYNGGCETCPCNEDSIAFESDEEIEEVKIKETNMEHNRADLERVLAEKKCGFAIVNGKICVCGEVMDVFGCKKCDFKPPHCVTDRMKWLMSEYKSKPVLTVREKGLVEAIREGWLTRDKSGRLYGHIKAPYKDGEGWFNHGGYLFLYMYDSLNALFPFITWEDEQPWSVEELRKLKVEE